MRYKSKQHSQCLHSTGNVSAFMLSNMCGQTCMSFRPYVLGNAFHVFGKPGLPVVKVTGPADTSSNGLVSAVAITASPNGLVGVGSERVMCTLASDNMHV